ncbi:MAG: acyltransferase [Clostridiales bacterium]|nr:acyltransferase [Clostridiales bacterium]
MLQSTSRKISYLQFACALLVIALHTVFSSYFVISAPWLARFHQWMRDIADAAIPTFFFLSAVLLMHSVRERSWKQIMLRKLQTLAVPYVLWTVVYLLVRFVRTSLTDGRVVIPSLAQLWTWIQTGPEFYIFWFLRTLFLLTMLYPVLMWCVRKRWPALLAAAVLMALNAITAANLPYTSVLYWLPVFLAGCYVGMDQMPRFEKVPGKRYWWIYAAAVGLLLLLGWLRRIHPFFYSFFWILSPFLLWMLADIFIRFSDPPWWIGAAFFLYCSHLLVERYAVKIYLWIFGQGQRAFVLSHLLLPILCAAMALLMAAVLRWLTPWLYHALTGLRKPTHLSRSVPPSGAA